MVIEFSTYSVRIHHGFSTYSPRIHHVFTTYSYRRERGGKGGKRENYENSGVFRSEFG